ncbi:hypothetical protein Q7P37_011128 [Cladosporium fusiforme]
MDPTPLPLIFITSTDSSIPQGRNARAQARTRGSSQSLRLQNKPTSGFTRSSLGNSDPTRRPKRRLSRRIEALSDEQQALIPARSRSRPVCLPVLPPSLPSSGVDPEAILSLARFHIARTAVVLVRYHPERLGDALRWRHWTYASIAPIATGERTACVDSALICLSAKLDDLLSAGAGEIPSARVLTCYERCLADLRHALAGGDVVRREDLLVTAQLLAVFEILHTPEKNTWAKHAIGAVSMLMSCKPKHRISRTSGWPVLTETLLDSGNGSFANAPRQALASLVLGSRTNDTDNIANIILKVATLIDDWWAAQSTSSLDHAKTFALLATAHNLRDQLRPLKIPNRPPSTSWKRPPEDHFDYLGFGLACLVALDQLIITLRPVGPRPRVDIDEDTHAICLQVLQGELDGLEKQDSPGKLMQAAAPFD